MNYERKGMRLPRPIFVAVLLCMLGLVTFASSRAGAAQTAQIMTSEGLIEIELLATKAPQTVANFVQLVQAGFYDGQIFFRVVPGYGIEAGDPKGNGTGGPGYCVADEFGEGLKHTKPGIVSMVSAGPNSNGSQFVISLAPSPLMDNRNPIFGEVTKGMDVVDKIAGAKRIGARPASEIKIIKARVEGVTQVAPFEKIMEFTSEQLQKKVTKPVTKLLAQIGLALELGEVQKVHLERAHSKCAESQLAYKVDFAKGAGSKLLLYGRAVGSDFSVEQFQFSRGK